MSNNPWESDPVLKQLRADAIEEFGRDHAALLLLIETWCVDNKGKTVDDRTLSADDLLLNINDLILAGLVEKIGYDEEDDMTTFKLTETGWAVAHRLRRNRSEGIRDKDFNLKAFLEKHNDKAD